MDPLRDAPISFDQWLDGFLVPEKEDRLQLAKGAGRLLSDPVFSRVLSEMEAKAIRALVDSSLSDEKAVYHHKVIVDGIRAVRSNLRGLAKTLEYEAKKNAAGEKLYRS